MNFSQLECFFAVADRLHFGRAARELHLSQSSVSEAISALERQLGAPLFERTTRRVRLTPLGEEFLARSRPPWEELHAAFGLAKANRRAGTEVVLGHTPELGHLVLPDLMAAASGSDDRAAPAALWHPTALHTHHQLEKAASGEIDIGLCWIPVVRPPLMATRLTRCPFAVILRAGEPLAERPRLSLGELGGHRIVISSRQVNLFIDARLQAALLQSGLGAASFDEVDDYEEVTLRVAARGGVGVHPASIVGVNRVPGLEFRLLDEPDLMLEVCAAYRSQDSGRLSPFIGALARVTTQKISESLVRLRPAGTG